MGCAPWAARSKFGVDIVVVAQLARRLGAHLSDLGGRLGGLAVKVVDGEAETAEKAESSMKTDGLAAVARSPQGTDFARVSSSARSVSPGHTTERSMGRA